MEQNLPSAPSTPELVNWDLAAGTAAVMAPAGPRLAAREVREAVADLRRRADESVPHVHRITGLEAARDLRDSQVLVVDRASWAKANSRSFATLLTPALDRLAATRPEQLRRANTELAATLTGAQLGAVLAFLASKVLGQYDPFAAGTAGTGGGVPLGGPDLARGGPGLQRRPARGSCAARTPSWPPRSPPPSSAPSSPSSPAGSSASMPLPPPAPPVPAGGCCWWPRTSSRWSGS